MTKVKRLPLCILHLKKTMKSLMDATRNDQSLIQFHKATDYSLLSEKCKIPVSRLAMYRKVV